MYREMQDKQTETLNPIIERINQISSKIYGDIDKRMQPYTDRLNEMYGRINRSLVNRLADISSRSEPYLSGESSGELRPPTAEVMKQYWDDLKPTPYMSPEPDQQAAIPPDDIEPKLRPGPLIEGGPRPSRDERVLPKPTPEKPIPECPDPKVYGLYCCPYTEINLMLDPELKKKRDDKLKDLDFADTRGSMKEAAMIIISEELAEETV